MAFKVNYNQQRAERDRAKAAKNEAKQREKEETARRKAEREIPTSATDASSSEEKLDGES